MASGNPASLGGVERFRVYLQGRPVSCRTGGGLYLIHVGAVSVASYARRNVLGSEFAYASERIRTLSNGSTVPSRMGQAIGSPRFK